ADLLGPGVVDLDAEAAADVGDHDVQLGQRHLEFGCQGGPQAGRGLGGGGDAQFTAGRVPGRLDRLALHRHAGAAFEVEVEFQHVRGILDGRRRVTNVLHVVGADVAGRLL